MHIRRSLIVLLTAAGVLGWCDVASATEYYSNRRNWPFTNGLLSLGIWSSITLLTGFIERPFYTWAGVERAALGRSIRINVLSSLVFGYFTYILVDLIFLLWPLSMFGLIFLITGLEYLLLVEAERRPVGFAQLLVGNAVSMFTVIGIFIAARSPLGKFVAWRIVTSENLLAGTAIGLSALWILGSIIAPLVSRRSPASRSDHSD